MTEPVLLAGSHAAHLVDAVADALGTSGRAAVVERFPDGELHVDVRADVGRRDVFVLQSLAAPAGEAALELLLLADAAVRAGAVRVSAVLPYFAYARADRRTSAGQPLGAKVMARVVEVGRFANVVAVDPHSSASAAAFDTPVVELSALPLLIEALRPLASANAVVVAPDLGAAKLAQHVARALDRSVAVVHKLRTGASDVTVESVSGDVAGKEPILVDDMIATGATLVAAVAALRARGCTQRPVIAATHGVFTPAAIERIEQLRPMRVLVTDSLAPRVQTDARSPFQIVPLAPLLAHAIRVLHRRDPLGDLVSRP